MQFLTSDKQKSFHHEIWFVALATGMKTLIAQCLIIQFAFVLHLLSPPHIESVNAPFKISSCINSDVITALKFLDFRGTGQGSDQVDVCAFRGKL